MSPSLLKKIGTRVKIRKYKLVMRKRKYTLLNMKISEDQSINESFGPKRLKNEVLVALRNL